MSDQQGVAAEQEGQGSPGCQPGYNIHTAALFVMPRVTKGLSRIDTTRNGMVLLGVTAGVIMSDMGTFRIPIELENPARPGERRLVPLALVDTGAELSWVPSEVLESLGVERYSHLSFRQASGVVIERWVGPAFIHVGGKRTTDDVVFGEPGDLTLLGARTLEGLNLRIEPTTKRLVDAGPVPAAVAS